jgi:CHAT domain-containing protein
MRTLPQVLSLLSVIFLIAIHGCSTGGLTAKVAEFLDQGQNALMGRDFGRAQERFQKGLAEAQKSGDYESVGFTLKGLGDVHRAKEEYKRAIENYEAALPFFSRSRNRFMEASTLQATGDAKQHLGQDQEAQALHKKAIVIWNDLLGASEPRETDKPALTARAGAFYFRANSHRDLRQFEDAVRDYRSAATRYRLAGDQGMAGLNLWFAAEITSDELMQSEDAIDLYAQAIPLLDEARNAKSANSARLRLGSIYLEVRKSGYAEKAAKVFGEALSIAEKQGLSEDLSHAHFGLARAFEMLAEFDKALTHYQAMLKQDQLLGGGEYTNPNYFGFYGVKAKIYRHLGRYEEAIENFSAALLKLREIKDEKGEANVSTMLAETYFSVDDPYTAIRYYKRALELYKKTGDTFSQINVLSALGELWLSGLVSSEEAVEYLETARQLLTSVKGLDLLTLLQGASANEAPTNKTLKELAERADETLTGKTLRDIGNFASEKLSSFDRWPVMVAGNFYQRFGRVALQDGKINDAEYIAAADLFLHLAWAYHQLLFDREAMFERIKDYYFLGEAERALGNLPAALASFRASEGWARGIRTPEIHWPYSGLARTYAELGEYENAIEYYKKGFTTLESIFGEQVTERSKIGVFAGASYVYSDLIPLLLETYEKTRDERYLHEAFHYTESLKARSFREMFFTSRAARLGGKVGEFAAKDETLRLEIQMINDQFQSVRIESAEGNRLLDRLDELRNKLVSLRQETAKQNRPLAEILASEPVTLRQVQDSLTSDDVLLEYSSSDKGLTVWIITKEDTRHAVIEVGKTVLEAFESYLKTLHEPMIGLQDISKHVTLGKELYRVLLGQAEIFFRTKNHLIIVLDGLLHYLPFEALIETSFQDETKRYTALADVPYLIKKFQISYVPSASVLVAQKSERVRQQPGQLPLLAFGDPVYRESQLSQTSENDLGKITNVALRSFDLKRLEFSGEEVRRIAQIWDVSPTSEHVNLGERATVERVRQLDLSRYRIIHFATHAVVGDQVGWASQPALVLSQQSKNDQTGGVLQFSDILDLKLNADLVVLSACETGLGKLRYGEGIIGLTRAFLYAGASSAVVSLWKVEDQSTSLLMEHFYRELKSGKNKADALRQAKLKILNSKIELKALGNLQSLASPFYWAPFVLVGDAAPLRN